MNFKGAILLRLMLFKLNNGNICTIQIMNYCSIIRYFQQNYCKENLLENISFMSYSYLISILSQRILLFLNLEEEEWENLTQFNYILIIKTKPKILKEQSQELIQESAHSILAAVTRDMELAKKLMITIKACSLMLLKSFQQAHLGQTLLNKIF